MYTSTI